MTVPYRPHQDWRRDDRERAALVASLGEATAALESLFNDLPYETRVRIAPVITKARNAIEATR